MRERIDTALEFDEARRGVRKQYRGWRDGRLGEVEERFRVRMAALNRKGPQP